jgi:hypothetical protein
MTPAGFEVIKAVAGYEGFYLPLKCWLIFTGITWCYSPGDKTLHNTGLLLEIFSLVYSINWLDDYE